MTTTRMCTQHSTHQLLVHAVGFNPSLARASTDIVQVKTNSVLYGEERITESDVICLSCYKCHLEICKASSDPENGSKDELQNFIAIWEYKYSDPSTDKLTKCILHVVLYLAKELFENRAALLPTLSRCFWLCIWTTQSTRTTRIQIAP